MIDRSATASGSRSIQRGRFKMAVAVLLLLAIGLKALWDYGPRPDIEFSGRVLDAKTKSPLADVYVLVNVRSFKANFAHGHSGCAYGEVIKTDAEGRFHFAKPYAEALTRKPNRSYSLHFGFYRPGWMPVSQKTPYFAEDGPDYLMTPDTTSFVDRGQRLMRMLDNNCSVNSRGRGWSGLWLEIFREGVDQYCDQSEALWADHSHAAFYTAQNLTIGMLERLSKQQDSESSEWPASEIERRLADYRAWQQENRDLFFSTQADDHVVTGPDVDGDIKRQLCAYLSPSSNAP